MVVSRAVPLNLATIPDRTCGHHSSTKFVEELQAIHRKIYDHLFASACKNNNNNDNNKVSTYKKRRHVEFEAGDLVWAILTKDGLIRQTD